jgi:8-oxo-dGTP pyrophosphatase MutT (NUDIX family)
VSRTCSTSIPCPDPDVASFRRLSEEEVFRGWLFTVGRVELVDPEGHSFERFIIHHPGAVTIVPVHDDGRVTLVRQYRASIDRMVLETPAGTCDVAGEPLEQTARRELAEEAGLQARSMEVLMGTFNTPGVSDQHTTIFLATGLTPCPTERAGVEEGFMTVETISLDDVDALVADGTLVDETTVLGLYLARRRLVGVEPGP